MLLKRLSDIDVHRGIRALNCHAELVSASRRSRNKFGMTIAFIASFFIFFLIPNIVLAAAPSKIILPNPLGTTNILDLGARLIQAGLGIAGSLALLFFIYGGFLWLTSGGTPDKIKKGRDVFLWSTVGLVIIFSSYMMVDFVIKALTKSKTEQVVADCQGSAGKVKDSCVNACTAGENQFQQDCEESDCGDTVTPECGQSCAEKLKAFKENIDKVCLPKCEEDLKNSLEGCK